MAAPDRWDVRALSARMLLEWGKVESTGCSTALFEESIKHFDVALALIRTPSCASEADRFDRARAVAEQDEVELLNDRGVALYEHALRSDGSMVEARAAFQQALERCPRDPRATCNMGLVEWAEGRNRLALQAFDRAVQAVNEINSGSAGTVAAHAHNNRGALQLELGEAEKALPDFHVAISIDEGYEAAQKNRDVALSTLNEPVPLRAVEEPAMHLDFECRQSFNVRCV
eukprot:CAMPEP_0115837494 /NCGR_PEP_ID=MMETSP0287-20121206/5248_1 /TAXON_ID=412157 /ORGANISM="Chrysochromulina rotalis, Strain UIO044" /LENGTH=229 /DNA_ID=CAMNT_0003291003 /DNA_START=48 /DNA_END=737 /DNA_ORIENTATION=-